MTKTKCKLGFNENMEIKSESQKRLSEKVEELSTHLKKKVFADVKPIIKVELSEEVKTENGTNYVDLPYSGGILKRIVCEGYDEHIYRTEFELHSGCEGCFYYNK